MNQKTIGIGVFESLCAGYSCSEVRTLPDNFIEEGYMMLNAVSASLNRTNHYHAVPLIHESLQEKLPLKSPHKTLHGCGRPSILKELVSTAGSLNLDRIIVIAPECDEELGQLLDQLHKAKISVWNCSTRFVRLATDKWALAQYLQKAGLPHPATQLLSGISEMDQARFPKRVVLKPRDGAGCMGICVFEDLPSMCRHTSLNPSQYSEPEKWIVQDWIEGVAASRSIVFGKAKKSIFPWLSQELFLERSEEGEACLSPSYRGARLLPSFNDMLGLEVLERFVSDFRQDLLGWVGFDFVIHQDSSGSHAATLIEVNPRFTTSFVYLQEWSQSSLLEGFL